MYLINEYNMLKQLLEEGENDVAKTFSGNKAAATRLRKKMQDVKAQCNVVRKGALAATVRKPVPPTPPII